MTFNLHSLAHSAIRPKINMRAHNTLLYLLIYCRKYCIPCTECSNSYTEGNPPGYPGDNYCVSGNCLDVRTGLSARCIWTVARIHQHVYV